MKNSIAERVHDFLKKFPPFDLLSADNLLEVSSQVSILYFEKGDTLYRKNDNFNDYFYVVRNGAIGLFRTEKDQRVTVDICDGGDIFGLRSLILKENYILDAIANEESIVYGIPIKVFESVTENNQKVNNYLITSFASNTFDPYSTQDSGSVFEDYIGNADQNIANLQTAIFTKNTITCAVDYTIQEAAIIMSEHKIGCLVIVNDLKFPIGIITNSDIKNKIATGKFPITAHVKDVMSSPVITFDKCITVAEAQLQMIKNTIGYLCITKDGTPNSKLKGILTQHDIVVSIGNNPSVLLKEIKRAKKTKTLRTARNKANMLLKGYLEQNIPISHILKIISEINDAVTIRVIELSLQKMIEPPPVKFTWLALGSQGRKEQLLFTDQDNALIFEDVGEVKFKETQQYFLTLSKLVTKSLHKIGYSYCPAEMMASNPAWCNTLGTWKKQFELWILSPDEKAILLSSIFFDFNYVYGDQSMANSLSKHISNYSSKNGSNFFQLLGKDALKSPPPLGFFRQILVDQDDEHKDLFNIKNRGLLPLIDAARILILSKQVEGVSNTASRFEKLAQLEPNNKELFNSCSYAFKALLKFKTKQGLLRNNSGQFIEPANLSKEDKMKLKRCFKPIREVQEILILRFRLGKLA
jgi:CBS domain-containing protein